MKPFKSLLFFLLPVLLCYDHSFATQKPQPGSFIDSVQRSLSLHTYKGNDPLLLAQHSQLSARSSALGYAGVAVACGPATAFLNPALLNASDSNRPATEFTVSYGRDSLFEQHITSAGMCTRISPRLGIGGMYRYLAAADQFIHHDVTLTLSGRLFRESFNQGAVDIGINFRWERMKSAATFTDSYAEYGDSFRRSDGHVLFPADTLIGSSSRIDYDENRFLADIGFFQNEIANNIDFGVVLKNLAGYKISKNKPVLKRRQTFFPVDTLAGSVSQGTDTTGYVDSLTIEAENSSGWMKGNLRSVTAGFSLHKQLVRKKILIQIPLDFEFFGLLDGTMSTHTMLRTGAELWIRQSYCLRFGYARAPMMYTVSDLENHNLFSGGAGVRFDRLSLDLFIKGSQEWGFAVQIGL